MLEGQFSKERPPELDDMVEFASRFCPQTKENGVMMLTEGHFVGWIKKMFLDDIKPHVEKKGRIIKVESFPWVSKSSVRAYRGTVVIY